MIYVIDQNAELTKKLEEAEAHRVEIEELIVKLSDERDGLESDKIAGEAARDALHSRVADLEALLDEAQNKYQVGFRDNEFCAYRHLH